MPFDIEGATPKESFDVWQLIVHALFSNISG
jgi:hypothetical protein